MNVYIRFQFISYTINIFVSFILHTSEEAYVMDVYLLKKYFYFGKLLGVLPIYTKRKILGRILPVLYTIIYLLWIVWAGMDRIHTQLKISHVQGAVDTVRLVFEMLFILTSINSSIYGLKNWKILIETLNSLGVHSQGGLKSNIRIRIIFIVQLIGSFIFWLTEIIGGKYMYISSINNLSYLSYLISNIYEIYMTLLVYNLAAILKRTINCYNYRLEATLSSNIGSKLMRLNIIYIKKLYIECSIIMQQVNIIFGWPIFFYVLNSLTSILDLINFAIFSTELHEVKNGANVYYGSIILFYLVSY